MIFAYPMHCYVVNVLYPLNSYVCVCGSLITLVCGIRFLQHCDSFYIVYKTILLNLSRLCYFLKANIDCKSIVSSFLKC